MIVNDYKDFYNKWEDVIGKNTYCHKLYEEKIKKTVSKCTTDFDFYALDDIMCNISKKDQYKSLLLLQIKTKTTILELDNSFYDKEGKHRGQITGVDWNQINYYFNQLTN